MHSTFPIKRDFLKTFCVALRSVNNKHKDYAALIADLLVGHLFLREVNQCIQIERERIYVFSYTVVHR